MAEPYRPAGEASDEFGRADSDATAQQPTTSTAADDTTARSESDAAVRDHERSSAVERDAAPDEDVRTRSTDPVAAPPSPAEQQQVLEPAAETAPAPPKKAGNRVVATAWVLLAAGLFQVVYFAALALIIFLLGGAAAVAPGIQNIVGYPFAWLPVLFFFLFFELTVLLFNRAGRFAYVVASLIVGFLVYVVSVLLISILVGGGIGDTATLARAFESPEFVLTGLVAREVMLWTGFAIGSRGIRVRRRNKEARRQYKQELADTDA